MSNIKKYHVCLTSEERKEVDRIIESTPFLSHKNFKARLLRFVDESTEGYLSHSAAAETLDVSTDGLLDVIERYLKFGLDRALKER